MKFFVLLALVGAACAVPISDTPEVAQAKSQFQAAFDKAAAAAEAAPDFDLDGSLSTYSGYLSTINGKLSPYFTNSYPYGAFGIHAPVVVATPGSKVVTPYFGVLPFVQVAKSE